MENQKSQKKLISVSEELVADACYVLRYLLELEQSGGNLNRGDRVLELADKVATRLKTEWGKGVDREGFLSLIVKQNENHLAMFDTMDALIDAFKKEQQKNKESLIELNKKLKSTTRDKGDV